MVVPSAEAPAFAGMTVVMHSTASGYRKRVCERSQARLKHGIEDEIIAARRDIVRVPRYGGQRGPPLKPNLPVCRSLDPFQHLQHSSLVRLRLYLPRLQRHNPLIQTRQHVQYRRNRICEMDKRIFDSIKSLFHPIETRVDIFLCGELFLGGRFNSHNASLHQPKHRHSNGSWRFSERNVHPDKEWERVDLAQREPTLTAHVFRLDFSQDIPDLR